MKVLRGDPAAWEPVPGGSVITIGVFDGVHVGHRQVGLSLIEVSRERGGLTPGVVTFDRHPLETIRPDDAPLLITTVDEQLELWEALGVGFVAILTFEDAIRSMIPAQFVEEVITARLDAKHVVVGHGFRFGRDGAGDVTELRRLGERLGFSVQALDLVQSGETPVSSTLIRSAIAEGDMDSVTEWLGRRFIRSGVVVPGANRGAGIGFATANLAIPGDLAIPGHGVYAAFATVDGERMPAVVNIGVRPTFDSPEEVVEAHLLDFDRDIYGRRVELEFVRRLRSERRFESVSALVDQISADVADARALLATQ